MSASVRDDDLDRSLEALSSLLLTDAPLQDALSRVAQLAVATVPACHAADVTVVSEDGARRDVHSNPDGPGLDEFQLASDDGPLVVAMRTGRPVRIASIPAEGRWPEFAARATDTGTRSYVAVPLELPRGALGALSFCSRDDGAFDDRTERVGELFAAQAAVVLANARLHQACVDLTGQLEQALASRAVIDQAKGILMARRGVGPDAAFDELRRLSQQVNRKVRDLAAELVESVVRA